jgi:L-histidine Nalpha-methyltransferase
MPSLAHLIIHSSQFPDNVRRDLLDSLRRGQVNHKFHYDSVKQTHQWLALHQAYSPSRSEPDCAAVFDRSFEAAASQIPHGRVHLIGLGCGGGQKDARLLRILRGAGKEPYYTPSDVSTAMVLVARQTALEVIGEGNCFPLVCDLATTDDLPAILDQIPGLSPPSSSHITHPSSVVLLTKEDHVSRFTHQVSRIITFFGMLPNFEPQIILARLAALIRPGDLLLLSANLAPGQDYATGVQRILPQYDNALTRDWLMTFLFDLGVEEQDGQLRFLIEDDPAATSLKRVAAYFHFLRRSEIHVAGQEFEFHDGESLRLFFSYRHTPALVRSLIASHGLQVLAEWIIPSQEEGVFLVSRLP